MNYSIVLTNASIATMSQSMSLNKIEPGTKLPVLEDISFIYEKIKWTWVDGGITTVDDWRHIT